MTVETVGRCAVRRDVRAVELEAGERIRVSLPRSLYEPPAVECGRRVLLFEGLGHQSGPFL